jgi:pimeloyl-ACP methyl ester carboxylesterase
MPDLALDDISLHYEIDGSGPPLLLLAGMMSDSASWGPLVSLLTAHFTVIRPDNRTTGRTTPWDAEVSVMQMAQDALALMDDLGHARFHVAGHSLGGLMTLEIAGLAPERVATAGVLASGRIRSPRTAAVFDALLNIRRAPEGEEMWLRALYPWVFGQAFFKDPANVETAIAAARAYPYAQTADAMAHQITAFRGYRPQSALDQITAPTLILYAGQDVMVPPEMARPGFSVIRNLTEVTVEDAGHSIVWDATADVAQHLLQHLTTNPIA